MNQDTAHITAGFIPLLDAAPLIVAREKGFAVREGIELDLVRETSWASIRDRVVIGHFDAAHMLAPMAIAGTLALPPMPIPLIAPIALGTGRNGITVSNSLWEMHAEEGLTGPTDAAAAARSLAAVKKLHVPNRPLVFAAVHTYSAHAYLLRYWLAEAGLYEGTDVRFEFVPPPFMSDALASGAIDGCCVGEPWNTAAVADGHGHVLTTGDSIWAGGPDKVLGMRADWATDNPDRVKRLVRALYAASIWADEPAHTDELAAILAEPAYLDTTTDRLKPGLSGEMSGTRSGFAGYAASIPHHAHAAWFAAQMARWGEVDLSSDMIDAASSTYKPDIYAEAIAPIADDSLALEPSAQCRLFDGRDFDSSDVEGYLSSF
ncbi:MAG: CmpA/NrtA family ABC transporter substrate-binding protein [Candidatus Phaeomarinobacter sp.]